MAGPTWLVDILAAAMIATALYCAAHLVAGWVAHRDGEHDADLMHIAMGVAMAGMLVGPFGQPWNDGSGLVFAAFAGWFVLSGVRALLRRGARGLRAGRLQHPLVCAAMVYMVVGLSAPVAEARVDVPGMAMRGMTQGAAGLGTASAAAPTAPTAVLLAVLLAGYAGWNVAGLLMAHAAPGGGGRSPLTPRLSTGCQIAMSLTMSYLLLAS